jgi:hypothetical protein
VSAKQIERKKGAEPVSSVCFEYQDRQYKVFAYGLLPAVFDGEKAASLIISGSGLNQSFGISPGDETNYHYGIVDALNGGISSL